MQSAKGIVVGIGMLVLKSIQTCIVKSLNRCSYQDVQDLCVLAMKVWALFAPLPQHEKILNAKRRYRTGSVCSMRDQTLQKVKWQNSGGPFNSFYFHWCKKSPKPRKPAKVIYKVKKGAWTDVTTSRRTLFQMLLFLGVCTMAKM